MCINMRKSRRGGERDRELEWKCKEREREGWRQALAAPVPPPPLLPAINLNGREEGQCSHWESSFIANVTITIQPMFRGYPPQGQGRLKRHALFDPDRRVGWSSKDILFKVHKCLIIDHIARKVNHISPNTSIIHIYCTVHLQWTVQYHAVQYLPLICIKWSATHINWSTTVLIISTYLLLI